MRTSKRHTHTAPSHEKYVIGSWGIKREDYLRKCFPSVHRTLSASGLLNEHLHDIDIKASALSKSLTDAIVTLDFVDGYINPTTLHDAHLTANTLGHMIGNLVEAIVVFRQPYNRRLQ